MWRWDQQEPFGNNVPDENPSGLGVFELPLRLPGQYFDKETNLHYNYFRDYDSGIGRYVQSDPIGIYGGLNTYAYVNGKPLTYADPDGQIPIPLLVIGAAALFGGGTVAGGMIGEKIVAEHQKNQQKQLIEQIRNQQENILLPACLRGSQAACEELIRQEELKKRCEVGIVQSSADQSNVPGGTTTKTVPKIKDLIK